MAKARVVYDSQHSKLYCWRVEEKTGLFKWSWRGHFKDIEEAIREADRIISMPYQGQVVYEPMSGYGD